jgi:hypothetical protein
LQATSTPSSTPKRSPSWSSSFLPSITDLIFVALLFSLACSAFAPRLLGDAGTGWHIRNGELMLHTHVVTRADPFSSTMSGKAWFAWEWLYDLLIAALHHWGGLNGVVFFTSLIVAATFALAFRLMLARGADLVLTVVVLALAIGASSIHLFARPHILSWLFAVIWFQVLDSWDVVPDDWRKLWCLPVLMIFWVNLHGGFLTGFFLLGIYLTGTVADYAGARGIGNRPIAQKLRRLAAVTVLTLLATLLNPYGYNLHLHIYQYLSDRFLMNHIQEFASPDFHGAAERCFAMLVLIAVVALAASRKKPSHSQVLVVIFAAASGLYASRNIPVSSLLLALVTAPLFSQPMADAEANPEIAAWLRRRFARWNSFSVRIRDMEASLSGHLWPVAAVLLGIWLCAHGGRLGSAEVLSAYFPEKRFPVSAVDAVWQAGVREPVFCPDYWGGYLIYRLYPETKVVVDDRHDLYGSEFFKEYLNTVRGEPGWQDFLKQRNVRFALLPGNSTLANLLRLAPGWRETYHDASASIFERK